MDSTPIEVCHRCRVHGHKVFKGLVKWGKNSPSLVLWLLCGVSCYENLADRR
ncbi:MAG: transposase [Nostoc sp.]